MAKHSAMPTTKRQAIQGARNVVIIAMIVAAVVVSFSAIGLKMLWDLRAFNSRVTSRKEAVRDQLIINLENAQELQTAFNIFETQDVNSEEVLGALPSRYDFPALATSIEALAARSGLQLASFNGDDLGATAANTTTSPTPVEMEFNIEVNGPFSDIKKFVSNLDLSIRPMKITSIELRGGEDDMTAQMVVETYYQPRVNLDLETETIR